MPHQNLGFETEDPADEGQAEDWSVSTVETGEELHGFADGSGGALKPTETFEEGWNNGDFLDGFPFPDDLLTIFPKLFDPNEQDRENFESLWQGNEGFVFDLVSIEGRAFDTTPEDVEDFEEEWDTNEDFLFDWNGVVGGPGEDAATFNTTNETQEDFIKEWLDIENFDFTFSGSPKNFHGGSGTEFEGFEVFKDSIGITVDPVTDVINASAHGFMVGDRVTFRNDGTGQLPGGIQPDTTYVVLTTPTANTLTIGQTAVSGTLDIQDFGTGAHFIDGDPEFVWLGTDQMASLPVT